MPNLDVVFRGPNHTTTIPPRKALSGFTVNINIKANTPCITNTIIIATMTLDGLLFLHFRRSLNGAGTKQWYCSTTGIPHKAYHTFSQQIASNPAEKVSRWECILQCFGEHISCREDLMYAYGACRTYGLEDPPDFGLKSFRDSMQSSGG